MKAINWVKLLLASCVYASMWSGSIARQKFRQQQQQLYKKSWPIGPRISMGNSIHISSSSNSFPQNRPMYKPKNYRVRRPPMYAAVQSWKTPEILGVHPNQAALPQRAPVKDFHSINKATEYSPEYRPEQAMPPAANRGHMDDDKGPIHTIPAPNLSPADKPYNIPSHNKNIIPQSNLDYTPSYSGAVSFGTTNYGFGTAPTSHLPQRITINPTTPAPTYHRYEVTETNEIGTNDYRTLEPTYFTPEFDAGGLSNYPTSASKANNIFAHHSLGANSGVIGTSVQYGHDNIPMQTNLHSSLHVDFPGTVVQRPISPTGQPLSIVQSSIGGQQISDLHVGHPAPAGPPLSATQLYDLLNSFPQVGDQYSSSGHQPQMQQHLLQQQLGQIFQQGNLNTFTPPQMQSFNYDEQSNKLQQQQQLLLQEQQLLQEQKQILQEHQQQQMLQEQQLLQEQQQQQQQLHQQRRQQQIFVGQDYASERVTADYSLDPSTRQSDIKTRGQASESAHTPENSEQSENNIEYEETSNQRGQSTYFTQVGREGSLASQYYTTLPNREAAEKLAALAAAGSVNSHLLGQLRKQQSPQTSESSMPPNHKNDRFQSSQLQDNSNNQQLRGYSHGQTEQDDNERQQQYTRNQDKGTKEHRPLRILVPDLEEYSEDRDQRPLRNNSPQSTDDYDYKEEAAEESIAHGNTKESSNHPFSGSKQSFYKEQSNAEYGSRIGPKSK